MNEQHSNREDHEYVRKRRCSVCMVVEPFGGKGVCCGIPTTDWEREVKTMIREPYLQDKKVVIVMDHLNSHRIWSLYESYQAAEAFEIAQKRVAAWQQQRNRNQKTVKWQFTSDDACTTLHSLYPVF